MIDVTRKDCDFELTLPDDRWIEIFDIHFTPGEPGNLDGPPENCWPSTPAYVEFEALVGDDEEDSDIKRNATDVEKDAVYEDVIDQCIARGGR